MARVDHVQVIGATKCGAVAGDIVGGNLARNNGQSGGQETGRWTYGVNVVVGEIVLVGQVDVVDVDAVEMRTM